MKGAGGVTGGGEARGWKRQRGKGDLRGWNEVEARGGGGTLLRGRMGGWGKTWR